MFNHDGHGLQQHKTTLLTLLIAKDRKLILQFAKAHENWTMQDWKNVPCSDESRFLLQH